MLNPLNSIGSIGSFALYRAAVFCGEYSRRFLGALEKHALSPGPDAAPYGPAAIDVVDAQGLDQRTFLEKYLRGNRPVIVRDGCSDWPAVRDASWTPGKLAERFGDFVVPIQGTYFYTKEVVTLREYCARLLEPRLGDVPYLRYHPLDGWREKILLHLGCFSSLRSNLTVAMFRGLSGDWRVPSFMPRLGHTFVWTLFGGEGVESRMPFEFGVYISPRGACTALHADGSRTHAIIAQIHGKKEAYFLPPAARLSMERIVGLDTRYVYLDDAPERHQAFAFRHARCELEAGDILFVPRNWLHEVHTVSDESVSLTFNFTIGWVDYLTTILQVLAFGKSGAHRLPLDPGA